MTCVSLSARLAAHPSSSTELSESNWRNPPDLQEQNQSHHPDREGSTSGPPSCQTTDRWSDRQRGLRQTGKDGSVKFTCIFMDVSRPCPSASVHQSPDPAPSCTWFLIRYTGLFPVPACHLFPHVPCLTYSCILFMPGPCVWLYCSLFWPVPLTLFHGGWWLVPEHKHPGRSTLYL